MKVHYHRLFGPYDNWVISVWDKEDNNKSKTVNPWNNRDAFGLVFNLLKKHLGKAKVLGLRPINNADMDEDPPDRYLSDLTAEEVWIVQGQSEVYTEKPAIETPEISVSLRSQKKLLLSVPLLFHEKNIPALNPIITDPKGNIASIEKITLLPGKEGEKSAEILIETNNSLRLDMPSEFILVQMEGFKPAKLQKKENVSAKENDAPTVSEEKKETDALQAEIKKLSDELEQLGDNTLVAAPEAGGERVFSEQVLDDNSVRRLEMIFAGLRRLEQTYTQLQNSVIAIQNRQEQMYNDLTQKDGESKRQLARQLQEDKEELTGLINELGNRLDKVKVTAKVAYERFDKLNDRVEKLERTYERFDKLSDKVEILECLCEVLIRHATSERNLKLKIFKPGAFQVILEKINETKELKEEEKLCEQLEQLKEHGLLPASPQFMNIMKPVK